MITLTCLRKEERSGANDSKAREFACKIDSEAVHMNNLPSSTVFREVVNSIYMKPRLKNSVLPNIIPKLVEGFTGSYVCGHTPPDEKGYVHFFEFCEFVEGSFREKFSHQAKKWSENKSLTDEIRCKLFLPLVHSVYFLGMVGFSVLDIKPDNIRINEKNEFVFTDIGLSAVFPYQTCKKVPEVKWLNRKQSTKYCYGKSGKKLNGLRLFTEAEILVFNRSHCDQQSYPYLGAGTEGFYDQSECGLRNIIRKGGKIEESDAVAEDMYQVAMMLLRYFNKPTSILSGNDWQEKAVEAANSGTDAMMNFMYNPGGMQENPVGGAPRQTAMQRYADFFCKCLGDVRMSATDALSHDALALLILDPANDLLAQGDGIGFPGGLVQDMGFAAELNPDWLHHTMISVCMKYQDNRRGLGIKAAETALDGAFAGFYPGAHLEFSDIKQYSLRLFTKYCVSAIGV